MKSYVTIRDKCDSKNQFNIASHDSEIRFMKININSYFSRERKNLNRVKTYMEYYSTFRIYKILNHNFSIYNLIDNRKIRNNIHDIATRHTYPVNKRVKIKPKLADRLG